MMGERILDNLPIRKDEEGAQILQVRPTQNIQETKTILGPVLDLNQDNKLTACLPAVTCNPWEVEPGETTPDLEILKTLGVSALRPIQSIKIGMSPPTTEILEQVGPIAGNILSATPHRRMKGPGINTETTVETSDSMGGAQTLAGTTLPHLKNLEEEVTQTGIKIQTGHGPLMTLQEETIQAEMTLQDTQDATHTGEDHQGGDLPEGDPPVAIHTGEDHQEEALQAETLMGADPQEADHLAKIPTGETHPDNHRTALPDLRVDHLDLLDHQVPQDHMTPGIGTEENRAKTMGTDALNTKAEEDPQAIPTITLRNT